MKHISRNHANFYNSLYYNKLVFISSILNNFFELQNDTKQPISKVSFLLTALYSPYNEVNLTLVLSSCQILEPFILLIMIEGPRNLPNLIQACASINYSNRPGEYEGAYKGYWDGYHPHSDYN